MRVIGYIRLSRAGTGHGLEAQRSTIQEYCERQGWTLHDRDGYACPIENISHGTDFGHCPDHLMHVACGIAGQYCVGFPLVKPDFAVIQKLPDLLRIGYFYFLIGYV